MATKLICGEAIIRLLESYGVDTVFGIPGVHTLELYRGLAGSSIRHILPRHEQGAGFMADGYARVSGRPGVCILITGPGVTNAATAMGQAYSDSVPMLVISSVNATADLGKGLGRLHEIKDQRALTAPITGFNATALEPGVLPGLIARAFNAFDSSRPRPVHIEIPLDVLASPVDDSWSANHSSQKSAPSSEAVATASELLAGAERPAIVAGGGASAAGTALGVIAEATGAGIVTTVAGKGVVPESHPLSLGATLPLLATQEWLGRADVILAIGTELAEPDFMCDPPELTARMIRVDIDAAKIDDYYTAHLGFVADAKKTADAISAALGDAGVSRDSAAAGQALASIRARNARPKTPAQRKHVHVLDALRRALPEDGIVFTDMTRLAYTGNHAYPCERPRTWFHPIGFGALGYALPAAIGASLAAPERPVVALTGDLGLLFSVQELATAAELALPLVILLWNDNGLGAIRMNMERRNVPPIAVGMTNPDFLMLATSFGCHANKPESLSDMEVAIANALRADMPTLIEISEEAPFLE